MLVPYPKVGFQWRDPDMFVVSSPWLTLTCKSNSRLKAMIAGLHDFSETRIISSIEDADTQRFLSTLFDFPLVFELDGCRDVTDISDYPPGLTSIPSIEAYTVLRYIRSDAMVSTVQANRLYQALENVVTPEGGEEEYLKILATIIRQNHFVTVECDRSIAPAAEKDSPVREMIVEFRNSEKNHDKLMKQSMRMLGVDDPEEIPVFESTRKMMELLREAAIENLFAFAVCVEAFEGGAKSTGSGLLGRILEKNERTKAAAKGLLQHDRINHAGEHHRIGLEIAKKLPDISTQEFARAKKLLLEILECQKQLIDQSVNLLTPC